MERDKLIYQPVRPFVVNQYFGENKACVSTDGEKRFITCDGLNPPDGFESVYDARGHLGIDLRAYRGQEVYAAQRGQVYFIDTNSKSGLDVRIKHQEGGVTFRTIYEHLLGYQPELGSFVETGQLIGWADNTGWSSNDHLHFQYEEMINGKWTPKDPLEVMSPVYAKNILAINHTIKYAWEQIAMLTDRFADFARRR